MGRPKGRAHPDVVKARTLAKEAMPEVVAMLTRMAQNAEKEADRIAAADRLVRMAGAFQPEPEPDEEEPAAEGEAEKDAKALELLKGGRDS